MLAAASNRWRHIEHDFFLEPTKKTTETNSKVAVKSEEAEWSQKRQSEVRRGRVKSEEAEWSQKRQSEVRRGRAKSEETEEVRRGRVKSEEAETWPSEGGRRRGNSVCA
jgi:hypothetical protein